jgi:hypothetical protein
MSKDNGGPAYPTTPDNSLRFTIESGAGMTLRDYFAAKAMQGMLAGHVEMFGPADKLVETAFKLADAMIAGRAK